MSKLSTKLNEEFFKLLPPAIFFFVALHLVMFIRVLMLEGTGFYMTQEQTEITETAKGPLRFLRYLLFKSETASRAPTVALVAFGALRGS